MQERGWFSSPLGVGGARRVTVPGCHRVLVVVPHVVAATRLLDLLPLLDGDHRLQIYFTQPEPCVTTAEFISSIGGLAVPWHQALQHDFDLVLAASYRCIELVSGPVLVLPHGASTMKSRQRVRAAGGSAAPVHGLDRELLVRDGRVRAAAIVLSHDHELAVLAETCPEALPAAVVGGDICLDRMRASLPYREHYRRALGVRPDEQLVTVSSTWTPESTFATWPSIYRELLGIDDVRVAAVLHPNIWSTHSAWQVRSWLADCRGLLVIPPEEGWRATMIASDVVVGDHGSTTQYAAAVGAPTLLACRPDVREGSLADALAKAVPHLDCTRPAADQLAAAARAPEFAQAISSRLDQAGQILRRTMYQLMGLSEPARAVPVSPVPVPRPVGDVH
ncbi:hypothetical protein FKR81_02085 [Lentzea tibetensis]|uniref:Uncharacterized protein n=1 Tax=Lentzea tibetensis TaxID=2591470 RepID=A0A563F358_9PSEU|nr:hypothetical protein [Lentzea tibetensis]TWP54359.1 hypothetical protein FKR81_02085 [Lentzea tibetensis]